MSSRRELIQEICNDLCRVIHGELISLVEDIKSSDLHCEVEQTTNKIHGFARKKTHAQKNYKSRLDSKRNNANHSKIDDSEHLFNKDGLLLEDSDTSNDSSIILSNLKTLVSNKKSKHAGIKKQRHKIKDKTRFVETYPRLENVDSVVQDDLYEAIVTTQFKKSKSKSSKDGEIQLCSICNYSSESKRLIRRHRKEHRYEHCKNSSLGYELNNEIYTVIEGDKMKRRLTCDICDFTTHRRKLMKCHKKLHKEVMIKHEYDCVESDIESSSLGQIKQKNSNHDFSGKNYLNNDIDDLERQRELSTISFSCNQCSYHCDSLAILNSHKLIHNAYTQFACGKCEFTCVSRSDLMKHKKSHKTI